MQKDQPNITQKKNNGEREKISQFMIQQPEKLILEWKAPSRPFKKHKKQYYTTIITIALLLGLILFFAGQTLTVAVVLAVAFLSYVMATIPPYTITNSITTYGVKNEEALYTWEELGRFWFEKNMIKTYC